MILIREPNRPDRASRASRHRLFGNPDDSFAQSLPKRGLITQAEVRAIALAQLDIRSTSVVWDIGAVRDRWQSRLPNWHRKEPCMPSTPNRRTSP